MKSSEINEAIRQATAAFARPGWKVPPRSRKSVTDLGSGRFQKVGPVMVNLAEEYESGEKLMFSQRRQLTPTLRGTHI